MAAVGMDDLDPTVDQDTAVKVRELQQQKNAAVDAEDYDEAKRLKGIIDRLKARGAQIKQLESRKRAAVEEEDYDLAKSLKTAIEKLRLEDGPPPPGQTAPAGGGVASRADAPTTAAAANVGPTAATASSSGHTAGLAAPGTTIGTVGVSSGAPEEDGQANGGQQLTVESVRAVLKKSQSFLTEVSEDWSVDVVRVENGVVLLRMQGRHVDVVLAGIKGVLQMHFPGVKEVVQEGQEGGGEASTASTSNTEQAAGSGTLHPAPGGALLTGVLQGLDQGDIQSAKSDQTIDDSGARLVVEHVREVLDGCRAALRDAAGEISDAEVVRVDKGIVELWVSGKHSAQLVAGIEAELKLQFPGIALQVVQVHGKPAANSQFPSTCSPGATRQELLAAAAKRQLDRGVFLSCTSKDKAAKAFATTSSPLSRALKEAGLEAYTHNRELEPGHAWPSELAQAAANSMVFVVFLSEHYYQDYRCMLELDLALNAHPGAPADGSHQEGVRPLLMVVAYGNASSTAGNCYDAEALQKMVQGWWSNPDNLKGNAQDAAGSAAHAQLVDAAAWGANMKALLQKNRPHLRLRQLQHQGGQEESEWQLAYEVAAGALRAVAGLLDVPPGVKREHHVQALLEKLQHLGPPASTGGSRRLELLKAAARAQQLQRRAFISHTGKDSGAKRFAASVLKPVLEAAGVDVYIDYEDLKPGCKWPTELVDAAANSMVFVAVLSKHYYTRYWCMLELDLALNAHPRSPPGSKEQGRVRPVVIPVLYDDDLSEVIPSEPWDVDANLPGKVVQQWSPRNLRPLLQDEEELPAEWAEWVDAVEWAKNLAATKGVYQHLRYSKYGPKDQDLQLARQMAAAALRHIPPLVAVPDDLVGVGEQVEHLLSQLGGRLGIWLHGPGGLGKSTVAEVLYNARSGDFLHTAILDVQQQGLAGSLTSVLKQLGSTGVIEDGVARLTKRLQNWVANKKVLYVLDNVWTCSQLEALLPVKWGEGSVVVVTSRFTGFPDSNSYWQVCERLFHTKVSLLKEDQARQLFRTWARLQCFMQDGDKQLQGIPGKDIQRWEQKILDACDGLPLALRLAGGAVRGKRTGLAWQGVYAALKQGGVQGDSEHRLQGIVTHSLQSLQPGCTSQFLDVATLLRGRPAEDALAVWRVWWAPHGDALFQDLQRSSLVGVDTRHRLVMHDVLVALGHRLVLQKTPGFQEHYGSRVWVQERAHVGYQQGLCTQPVAVQLSSSCDGRVCHGLDLSQARILWLDYDLPAHSKVLWLELAFSARAAPWLQQQPGLVICSAKSGLQSEDLNGAHQWMPDLHSMNLHITFGRTSLPEAFGHLPALRKLDLSGCRELNSLPSSFGHLAMLQQLNLSECESLTSLPESFGKLSALQQLSIRRCTKLTRLPKSFGDLAALQQLDISACRALQLDALPESFRQLTALQRLSCRVNDWLCTLPEFLGELPALRLLDLDHCWQLTTLPTSLGRLSKLEELQLFGCTQLLQLPTSIGQLSRLLQLDVSSSKLSRLPMSIGHLSALQWLDLSCCELLTGLPESFGQLLALRKLSLSFCERLATLPESFGQLSTLQQLDLHCCGPLAQLHGLFAPLLTEKLRSSDKSLLDTKKCWQLVSLPRSVGHLPAFEQLRLQDCKQLISVPETFWQVGELQKLDLGCCHNTEGLLELLGQLSVLGQLCLAPWEFGHSLDTGLKQLELLLKHHRCGLIVHLWRGGHYKYA